VNKKYTKLSSSDIIRLFRESGEPNFMVFLNNNPEVLEHEETIDDDFDDQLFTDRMWTYSTVVW
jgi:hypothetical protein